MLIDDIPYFAYHFRTDIAAAKPARVRSFKQRDLTRALRATTAAGVSMKVVFEENRMTLVPTTPVPEAAAEENPWKKLRHG